MDSSGEVEMKMSLAQPLRPMNLGEILDRTFEIYRSRFLAFFGIAAVPALVVQGVAVADAYWFHLYASAIRDNDWTPGIYMTQLVFRAGYYHIACFVGFFLFPVILKLISGNVFGEEIAIGYAWRFFGARWRSYLWLALLTLIAGLMVVEFLTILLLGLSMEAFDALGATSFLDGWRSWMVVGAWFSAGLAAFFWVWSSLSLAIPSAALEDVKVFRALRRSWVLSRGSRLRIAFRWLALAILSLMLAISSQWLLRFVVILIARSTHERWIALSLYPALSRTMSTAVATVLGPIYPIAITLFYYDQRVRREGFDIERMMEAAGMGLVEPPVVEGGERPGA